MEHNQSFHDEIEESLRICEEIFSENPDFIPEKPEGLETISFENEAEKEPIREPKPEPKVEPKPEIKSEPAPKPEIKSEPDLKSENKPELEHKPEIKMEPDPKPRFKTIPEQKNEPDIEEKKTPTLHQENQTIEKMEFEPVDEKDVVSHINGKPAKRGITRTIISLLICVVIAVGVATLITKFIANHTTVEGESMEPCLTDGDELIVEKLSYMTGEPQRNDIIVFQYDKDTKYIKRVIGLPGESIKIEEGKIYINGRAMFDKYGNAKMEDGGIAEKTIKLGKDEYFVLGDNRNSSKDSRSKSVGVIKSSRILGRAWFRVLPFSHIGTIE